jgi:dienelactone hydrolase
MPNRASVIAERVAGPSGRTTFKVIPPLLAAAVCLYPRRVRGASEGQQHVHVTIDSGTGSLAILVDVKAAV